MIHLFLFLMLGYSEGPPVCLTSPAGSEIKNCMLEKGQGFTRNGFCETGPQDRGSHTVCAVVTKDFLAFTKVKGNDLSTPNLAYGFKGLKPGDSWCLCASRWLEAFDAGVPPDVDIEATEISALRTVSKDKLLSRRTKANK